MTISDELVGTELEPGVEELAVDELADVVDVAVDVVDVVAELAAELALLDAELEGATTPQAANTSTKNESNAVFFICKIIPPKLNNIFNALIITFLESFFT